MMMIAIFTHQSIQINRIRNEKIRRKTKVPTVNCGGNGQAAYRGVETTYGKAQHPPARWNDDLVKTAGSR